MRKIELDDAPDNLVVNARISVNQHVAKANDAGQFRNSRGGFLVDLPKAIERLPYDF